LTATPATGSAFAGWSGGGCTGTGTCTVTPTATTTVTATFNQQTQVQYQTLIVGVSGKGTVTIAPTGMNCSKSCSATYSTGAPVTLRATSGGGFAFIEWSGACTGTGSCSVSMTSAQTVNATFRKVTGKH